MAPTHRIRARLHAAIAELEAVVRDRPDFDPSQASRRFVLATVDYLALLLVPRLRRALARAGPALELAVYAVDAGGIAAQLEAGIVDLYLGVRGATERTLKATHLFDESFALLVRPGHPLTTEVPTPEAYVRVPHVHVSPRREGGTIVGRAIALQGLLRKVAVEAPYFSLVPGLLRDSDLVATVPQTLARLLAEEHGLVAVTPPIVLPRIAICMAHDPRFEREPALEWFRQLVQGLASEVGESLD